MGVRSGAGYLEGLREPPRDVWVSGGRVDDDTTHPAFRVSVQQLACLYDTQLDPVLAEKVT